MRNKYRVLKIKIIIQTIGISLFVGAFGYFVLDIFVDGILQDPFAKFVVSVFQHLGFTETTAIHVYRVIFWNNKALIVGFGFFVLFIFSFYLGMSKFTTYLREVEAGIGQILAEDEKSITLPSELVPLENQLNEIKTTLTQKQRKAEESEQKKNDLVVYLAHDLKTPLTSIIAYLSLLEETPEMPEEQRIKYTKISLEKSKRLGQLINEFFEITRYNLQDISLEKISLSLYVLLDQVLDSFYPVFKEKNMTCQMDVDEDIILEADPDCLARVFENLLRNAVSYSYQHTTITVKGYRRDNQAVIQISNHGKTIAKRQLEKLFEKFYRLDESRSSQTGGSGLGLAISRQIIDLHQGKISVDSQDGCTTFTINLPIKKEDL